MSRHLRQFANCVSLLLFGAFLAIPSEAQVLAVNRADAGPAPALFLEVTVLGLPNSGLQDVELFFPEPEPGASDRATGFAIVLPDEEAKGLTGNPRAILVHKFKQPLTANPLKFRIDARTPSDGGASSEAASYYEVGIAFEVSSNAGVNRGIALSTSSVVQIRRGPGSAGGPGPLLLETQPITHDLQVQEDKSILLGGFFNAADAARLPDLPAPPESPLLNYILSKAPRRADDNEIVVLLTPRRIGGPAIEPVPIPFEIPALTAFSMPPVPEVQTARTPVPEVMPAKIIPEGTSVLAFMDRRPVLASVTAPPAVVAPPFSVAPAAPVPIPVASPVPVPVSVPKAQAPFYTVQAGAFQSRAKADALAAKLEKKFGEVFVDDVQTGNTPYRVRVGRLPSARAAREVRASLADQGFDSIIVTPDSR